MSYKRFAKAGIVMVLSISMMTGCATLVSGESGEIVDTVAEESTNVNEEDVDMPEFEVIGEVIQIDNNNVHIIFGDIVEIFTVTNPDDVYLGQQVKVINEDNEQRLEPYLVKNFVVKHTNMGDMIESISGIIEKVSDDSLEVKTDNKVMKFKYFGSDVNIQKGDSVDVEFVQFGTKLEEMTVTKVLPMESAMELTINSTQRVDSGLLIVKGADENGMESYVSVRPGTNDNFNLSELKVGDKIEVIPEVIMESYPMQVQPLRIRVINE